jgi:hypothetical protein
LAWPKLPTKPEVEVKCTKVAAALVAEEPRGSVRYIERAEQMNFDHQLEVGDAHLVKDCIAQNAGDALAKKANGFGAGAAFAQKSSG